MKDLNEPADDPQAVNHITRELRLIHVGDGDPRDAPADDRGQAARARSARRRLFADDNNGGQADEEVAAGGSGGGGTGGGVEGAPRRQRLAEPLVLYELQPEETYKMVAEDLARASRRWNFDFINDRPLLGPWMWQKVVPRDQLPVVVPAFGDVNGNTEPMELADGSTSPQR